MFDEKQKLEIYLFLIEQETLPFCHFDILTP